MEVKPGLFCYVKDLVEGIYKLLFSDYTYPINLGNPNEITISDFALEIMKITGSNQKITYHPLPKNDPMQRKPDIKKALEILNWSPKIDRSEGLRLTLDWFTSLPEEVLFNKDHRDFKNYIKKSFETD